MDAVLGFVPAVLFLDLRPLLTIVPVDDRFGPIASAAVKAPEATGREGAITSLPAISPKRYVPYRTPNSFSFSRLALRA